MCHIMKKIKLFISLGVTVVVVVAVAVIAIANKDTIKALMTLKDIGFEEVANDILNPPRT